MPRENTFAFNPDVGPARILRFVGPGVLPDDNWVAYLLEKENVLIINKEHYDKMHWSDQHNLQRTHQRITRLDQVWLMVPETKSDIARRHAEKLGIAVFNVSLVAADPRDFIGWPN